MIIWCMVLEIWSAKDRIFCHFRPFFALFPYNKKNQNFGKKKKKTPGDIIILQKFTKNYNHINGSWDTEKKMAGDIINLHVYQKSHSHDACFPEIRCTTDIIFCHFEHFLPFSSSNTPKNQNFGKKKKQSCRYYHFKHVTYGVWFLIWSATEFFVTLDRFLHFYPTNNLKILKKIRKKTLGYHHFTHVYQNLWSHDLWFLRYGGWWMGRWMDGKSDI